MYSAGPAQILWKKEKAFSLGIPKAKLPRGKSRTADKYGYREITQCFGRMEDLFGRDRLSEALRERVR